MDRRFREFLRYTECCHLTVVRTWSRQHWNDKSLAGGRSSASLVDAATTVSRVEFVELLVTCQSHGLCRFTTLASALPTKSCSENATATRRRKGVSTSLFFLPPSIDDYRGGIYTVQGYTTYTHNKLRFTVSWPPSPPKT